MEVVEPRKAAVWLAVWLDEQYINNQASLRNADSLVLTHVVEAHRPSVLLKRRCWGRECFFVFRH